jgi:tripartite-type tricarboxylate transporter receptor subunit TctC
MRFRLSRRQLLKSMLAGAAGHAFPALASQGFPSKPLNWVVPYAAGAATDILTRRLAQDMAHDFGQQVLIENVPGGGTVNAAVQVTRSKPDGYRVMTADSATLALNPALMDKLPYDPLRSFTTIGMFARFPLFLVVHKDVPARTLPELVDYIVRTRKSDVSYGSAGLGSPHHMAMELLQDRIGSQMVHVPYAGAGPALTDLLGGRLELMFSSLSPIAQYVSSGALRVIAGTGSQRFPTAPDIPTMAEADARLQGYEVYAWQGVVGPAGLPADVRQRWAQVLHKTASSEAVKQRFLELGIEAAPSTPQAFESYIAAEAKRWSALVKSRGIRRE